MFGFIMMLLLLASLTGGRESAGRMLRWIVTMFAVVYGIRFILFTGLHLLPLLLIFWAVTNVAEPFLRGFFSSFRNGRHDDFR